ncbi:hypothetical protein BC939DRAFT_459943 [Gamsiella multidivaricata]|uniref:uncharacterized protein n=1 Tax=Gamsiella multidivaricata TaxID=101098 RepID=UPI00221F3FE4|nr:uncharacterized protein BC939DRAFT_459943 [Gamsiella multidivaricata]KAI7819491.1 hypothetical protein BC939DRAFT_459943 [Gamsiella multidivaricata]
MSVGQGAGHSHLFIHSFMWISLCRSSFCLQLSFFCRSHLYSLSSPPLLPLPSPFFFHRSFFPSSFPSSPLLSRQLVLVFIIALALVHLRSMGNTTTKEKADHIDGGALLPHGVYSGPQDYDFRIVQRLILQRKLAPFYKGLDDWDDSEDAQEEKEKQQQQQLNRASNTTTTPILNTNTATATTTAGTAPHHHPHHHQQHRMSEAEREMRRLYQGAIECPICFLVRKLFLPHFMPK